MKKQNNKSQSTRDLQFENELRKAKIMLQSGAHFFNIDDNLPDELSAELAAELESEFLNNIESFESTLSTALKVKVYDFIGKPTWIPECQLDETQVEIELRKMLDLMNNQGIDVDSMYEVPSRVFYKFITEELFQLEMNNIRVPGMMLHYIYEEFYPNYEREIEDESIHFLKSLLKNDFYSNVKFFNTVHVRNWFEVLQFRECLEDVSHIKLKIKKVSITGYLATVSVETYFESTILIGAEPIIFEGDTILDLELIDDAYLITKIIMPTMKDID